MDQPKLEGYQRLEQDFFRLCKIREIKGESQILLIYLRGLYCRFGKPNFYCPDKNILEDLYLSRRQLHRIRKTLQLRGAIEYKTFKGRGKAAEYLILKTELAPIIKRAKMSPFMGKMSPFIQPQSSTKRGQNVPSIVINRIKKEAVAFVPVDRNQMKKDVNKLIKELYA